MNVTYLMKDLHFSLTILEGKLDDYLELTELVTLPKFTSEILVSNKLYF